MTAPAMNLPVLGLCLGGAAALTIATLVGAQLARRGFPLPPDVRRIGHVDGLRGYLALAVMIHHFTVWIQVTRLGGTWSPPAVYFFAQLGSGAVALFFMTTGLLFYPRILAGFRACSWPAIYISRVFRILPLIAFSVGVMTVIAMTRTGQGLGADFPLAALQWIATTGSPPLAGYRDSAFLNAGVLWSLQMEWIFYLCILPLCALLTDMLRGRLPSWVLPALLLIASQAAPGLRHLFDVWRFMPFFAVGMLAFEIRSRPALASRLQTRGATILAVAALAAGMTLFKSPNFLALPFFAFFFFCVACGNDMGGVLRLKGALALGECSYGIYLMHGILLNLLFVDGAFLIAPIGTRLLPALLPIAAVAIVLLTALTYLLVERPAIKAGRFLSDKWRRSRPAAGPKGGMEPSQSA
jgi:peptidoglycan/LPS O-acetylase OafA/YrhL